MSIALAASLLAASSLDATAQLAPPMVRGSKPIGAGAGDRVALEVQGSDFREGASLRFEDPRVTFEGVELGKGEGNGLRTLKAWVTVPAKIEPGPLRFRVVGEGGVSNPGPVPHRPSDPDHR